VLFPRLNHIGVGERIELSRKTVSGTMLTLLLISMLTLAFKIQPVKASGTIYIRADGSIEGTTSIQTTDNVTYVFTANINYDYIIVERNNIIIDGKGYVLQGADAYNSTGIDLSGRTNVTVKKAQVQNFIYGILLHSSSDCSIFGNKVTITNCGIELGSSSNNTVSGNNVTANRQFGIRLDFSSNNTIFGNNVISNQDTGINVESSSGNTIFGNNVTANNYGVYFCFSSWNNITANCVANNQYGILFDFGASNNIFYHNNFMNNFRQVYWLILANAWDDGYPSGGNYWSDYVGVDVKSGPSQDLSGSDGIGDTSYIIDTNKDRYPLMKPYGAPPSPIYALTITATVGGTTNPSLGTYSYTTNSTVQVTAIPEADYLLDHWELDSINMGSANPYTVTMDENHTLKAVFSPVAQPLSASISPLSQSINLGQSVTFTSTVSGGYTPYSYQWYLNGNPVSGATSDTWTFTPIASGIYYIRLIVTDAKANTAQSDLARITVATVPVGGYSTPIQGHTTDKPLTLYLALVAMLTVSFTMRKRKTHGRKKEFR